MDYTNWRNKAPDSKLLTADTCVTTRVVDGVWHLTQCSQQLGFICKTNSGKVESKNNSFFVSLVDALFFLEPCYLEDEKEDKQIRRIIVSLKTKSGLATEEEKISV